MTDNAHKARRPTILVVDDEEIVTKAIRSFLEVDTNYRVLTHQSPKDALEAIQHTPPDVVISDFLMPVMNGLEFLGAVKALYPDVPRIMLTGYADKENSIRAINEVGLFQYLEKPWDNDQLRMVIDGAVSNKSLKGALEQRIRELDAVLRDRDHLARRDETLREELAMASRIQRGMLPVGFRDPERIGLSAEYVPAFEIGGDFYDVIPLSGARIAVLVADVTGHGIQAALSTAALKLAFSNYRDGTYSGTEILLGMNQHLLTALPHDTFAAALVTTIDTDTRTCHLVNAGLPHPFLLPRGNGGIRRIGVNGLMLGLIDEPLYKPGDEHVIRLEPRDLLIIHTDGVDEAQNSQGEYFGDRMLVENLRSAPAADTRSVFSRLLAACREFSAADHEWDDITLFGIEGR